MKRCLILVGLLFAAGCTHSVRTDTHRPSDAVSLRRNGYTVTIVRDDKSARRAFEHLQRVADRARSGEFPLSRECYVAIKESKDRIDVRIVAGAPKR